MLNEVELKAKDKYPTYHTFTDFDLTTFFICASFVLN